jgi:FlaA1/EpsC-like NDP-sugar epimerase
VPASAVENVIIDLYKQKVFKRGVMKMQLFGRPDHKNHSLVVPGTSQKCARNRPQCISQKCARNRPQCILVTGGAGYIGSHTCVALLEAGHVVTVVDNLCNSKMQTIDRIKQITKKDLTFYQKDVTDEAAVDTIFSNHSFDGIIHFAGFKAVGESVEFPLKYYYNNTVSTMVLAKYCLKYGVKQFVFSSSATVYGCCVII